MSILISIVKALLGVKSPTTEKSPRQMTDNELQNELKGGKSIIQKKKYAQEVQRRRENNR